MGVSTVGVSTVQYVSIPVSSASSSTSTTAVETSSATTGVEAFTAEKRPCIEKSACQSAKPMTVETSQQYNATTTLISSRPPAPVSTVMPAVNQSSSSMVNTNLSSPDEFQRV